MQKMILWTIVLFTPLLWTTTHAIFGLPDVAALAQRVTIIANQGTQIAQSVTQLARMREQFDKLKEQYDHIRQSTLGEIGALTEALTDLSALPGSSSAPASGGARTLPTPTWPGSSMRSKCSATTALRSPSIGATACVRRRP